MEQSRPHGIIFSTERELDPLPGNRAGATSAIVLPLNREQTWLVRPATVER